MRARHWLAAGVAGSQWLATVVLAAAAGAVMLTLVAGPGVDQEGGRLLIPLLACVPVVVLRRWPLAVLAVATVTAGMVAAWGLALLPCGILLGLALYFSALGLPRPKSVALAVAVAAALGVALGVAVAYLAFAVMRAPVAAEVVENFVPPWAMIWVIAGWIVGWPLIGAWRMSTRDA